MKTKIVLILSVVLLAALLWALWGMHHRDDREMGAERIILYCAAGVKKPVEETVRAYEQYVRDRQGKAVRVEVHYGGSGDLLSRLSAASDADLFLAGDATFLDRAKERGLIREAIPLALMKPVLATSKAAVGKVTALEDLSREGVRVGLGDIEGSAIGQSTHAQLVRAGLWDAIHANMTVTKPTVTELAMDLLIGSIDAAIVWDAVARQFGLAFIEDERLDGGTMEIAIGIASNTLHPTRALHFARFLGAPEHGLKHFAAHHFLPVDGDAWAEIPELTLFSGAVNRRAIQPLIESFEKREGVRINSVYNGCGFLTTQMRAIKDQEKAQGFPDVYLACDVYYMDPVEDWFDSKSAVSGTRMVIVTAKGNPLGLKSLFDLTRPGLRVILGHATHTTIGALTDRWLRQDGVYDEIQRNVVEQSTSSALLVPAVVTGAADAAIAYYSDTLIERDKLDIVEIDSPYTRAVQPFGRSRKTPYPFLSRRLYEHVSREQAHYEALGFDWLFGEDLSQFEMVKPGGAADAMKGAPP
jgi:molybdate transport system substrate-binding protein